LGNRTYRSLKRKWAASLTRGLHSAHFGGSLPSIAKPANEPGLYQLGQQRIAQQQGG
jgi:hypothetical protein